MTTTGRATCSTAWLLTVTPGTVSLVSLAALSTNYCTAPRACSSLSRPGEGPQTPEIYDGRTNCHGCQRNLAQHGHMHSPVEGTARMVRAVYPDDDPGHLCSSGSRSVRLRAHCRCAVSGHA